MTASDSILKQRQAAVPQGIGHVTNIVCERADNAELWDVDGRRYIDFSAGIAVLNTGHIHPKVKAAVQQQLEKFSHTCFHVALYPEYIALAERLNKIVPTNGPNKTMLVSTGAEAVENAVKIARAHTKRAAVIAFAGAFHGRTLMGMALTGKVSPYKANFGPMPAEVFHAHYPNAFHGISVEDALKSLDGLLKTEVDPARVAAIIVEPVQGEGGFYIAPPAFLQALRKLCDAYGIVLIVDEIQTGFARTGKLFAIEHAGVKGDIVTMAKGLGGGFPLSAVTGTAAIMDAPNAGGLGGTYAGSPIGCAAAMAVLDVIEEEALCERAQQIGQIFVEHLQSLKTSLKSACIGDIRNLGAMIAMELVKNGNPEEPNPDLTKALVAKAREKGLIILSCGTRANVIRFLPALTISDQLIREGLGVLEQCFSELS